MKFTELFEIRSGLKKRVILTAVFIAASAIVFALMLRDYSGIGYWAMSIVFFAAALIMPFLGDKVWTFVYKYLKYPILVLFPAVLFYFTEKAMDTGYSFNFKLMKFILLNYIIYASILFVVYFVTLSMRWAILIDAVVAFVLGIGNYFVILFRQIPILAGDLFTVGTAMNVASGYSYTISMKQFTFIMFFIASLSFFFFARMEEPKRYGAKIRIPVAVLGAAIALCGAFVVARTDILDSLGSKINTFRPIKSYAKYGGMLTFTRTIRLMVVDAPDGYSLAAVEELTEGYESDSASDDSYVRPNVIVVMNEAFSDLQDVGDMETLNEVMPFYNSLTENAIKGRVYVSVFGGQTANSEYEFLTGDSKALLPAGSTPYQLYIRSYIPSLTGNLGLDGYLNLIAIHPYNASGYNRSSVYSLMGFTDFVDITDFDENVLKIGEHISDSADVDKIIEEYEANEAETDEPFYTFNVTMQNHSPFTGEWANLSPEVTLADESYNIDGSQNYLNLIHASDEALEKLVTYFENVDEPTVIVHFGDHEPGLSDEFYEKLLGEDPDDLTDEESMNLYHTPFLIWANYDIDEENYQFEDGISLNYLQAVMLDACGMKESGYTKYLLDLMEELPIINICGYKDADGNFYDLEDETSPYYETINNYNMLIYNHLFDTKNRLDEFFEYGE